METAKGLVLRANVLKGRNLAAKDRSGTSDPYLVLSCGDAKEATPVIDKSLNPEWNTALELPIVGEQSLLLEIVCWDKDRFGKDYMGEFDVVLEDLFQHGRTHLDPQWFPLESKRTGKKSSFVSGEVEIQFSLVDMSNANASPEQIISKFLALATQTPGADDDEEDAYLQRGDSNLTDLEEEDTSDEAQDESKKAEKRERQRKKLRLAKLKKKAKQMSAYEYSDKGDIAGVLFLEIQKVLDLPPERNMTRTSFDMDPFVVTSLGKKTYRTRTVNHNLNPVFDEKLVFQVLRHEINYSASFTVVDKDKFTGNDYVGTVNFPLDKAVSVAPQADERGIYRLPEPSTSPGISGFESGSEGKKSRFRLPMSRSSSTHSLSRIGKPSLKNQTSSGSLSARASASSLALPVTSSPQDSNGNLAAPAVNINPSAVDDEDLKMYTLPLEMKNKDRWEDKHNPTLYIRAKYLPYRALRQQFWRAMLKQYDADDSGLIDKVELTTMLDTLGSTLHESTIDSFFERFSVEHNGEGLLTFDETVICLEDQLQITENRNAATGGHYGTGVDTPSSSASGSLTPINKNPSSTSIPALEINSLGRSGEEGSGLHVDDLADEKGEEHVIEIRECPICHQPKLNKRSDANIITHIATCASQDWRQVNNIVMAGFVTSSQAQRKWYSKVITKISYGGYKLGANSANILVQDRITGQINEERMSVYVRLGIRLLYKGLKSNSMETKRIRKLLKSLSFKQGRKYDDPASAAEIAGFVAFHQLDMSEVLLSTAQFKSFNEFFYRALKPGARPCSAPEDPRVIVSPADCRSVVFNTLDAAQAIWVKGREFNVERLLGDAYPEDAKRYHGGSLGIFRLAPQDYHRFHIPVDGILDEPKTIEGEYYTVNPMAIRSALDVYGENVRVLCPIDSVAHGRVMVICVGAMMVGSTVITRQKGERVNRAEELGYFKFGGSTILLLFEPGVMKYDDDLADNSRSALETLVRVGMSIGHSPNRPPHSPDMQKNDPSMEEKQDAKRRIEGSLAPEGVTGPMYGAGM